MPTLISTDPKHFVYETALLRGGNPWRHQNRGARPDESDTESRPERQPAPTDPPQPGPVQR